MLCEMPPKAVMKILTGPPGTGKTYRAVRDAVRAIEPATLDEDVLERHQVLLEEGRIVWVTFHPSYTYEDFVEGIRPSLNSIEGARFIVKSGTFKLISEKCSAPFRVGDKLGKYTVTKVENDGLVLGSHVKKTNAVSSNLVEGYADFWSIERGQKSGLNSSNYRLQPSSKRLEINDAAKASGLPSTFWSNSSRHAALWDALSSKAMKREDQSAVLVIDEINRADLSRVFGELMTLLELDKRAGEPEEKRITLPYSGEQFSVPATLSIIGTMNTADRSLAVLDYALRRRFTFEEVAPDPLQCAGSYGGLNLGNYLIWMNRVVTALLSRDNRIGHVDLMHSRLEDVREQGGWPDNPDGQLRAVAWTLRHKTAPLLLEYFHEDWQRASRALGQQGAGALLTEEDFSDIAALDADLDLRSSYVMEDWWNPDSGSWDSERFRQYMLAIRDVGSLRTPPAIPAGVAVPAPAPTAPSTPTTTMAAPLPAPEEMKTPENADAAEQNGEEPDAVEDQLAQE